jgi:hypothetical protein
MRRAMQSARPRAALLRGALTVNNVIALADELTSPQHIGLCGARRRVGHVIRSSPQRSDGSSVNEVPATIRETRHEQAEPEEAIKSLSENPSRRRPWGFRPSGKE